MTYACSSGQVPGYKYTHALFSLARSFYLRLFVFFRLFSLKVCSPGAVFACHGDVSIELFQCVLIVASQFARLHTDDSFYLLIQVSSIIPQFNLSLCC